ncbi:hypothetical protein BD780_003229 [Clostridium tetanomorphum]|uniref:Uncharacterized protein n=1 Tax=Clostridium tetanomorphum TaxID=1553 RepID=A0A923EAG3_CLOTT|nr:hypothetical protein [Clostridium tetanomorphum]KAJ49137.1 hypothetical protein CTM_24693 [Clostridium tetanomorphum DSM 665]KAJ53624.1 hypothetical protein CTM_01549 [Clostridium tetanomorphum DSM 665]MBC2399617.1 hypothetical protein [Clostridium tetanomorphum]MBP1866252.1 hypothetical protein [Clostridium tetanomorphum]NRS86004.1 hypothetical protein [Clostridium tetanomorphum]
MDKLFQFVSKRKYLISDVITKKGISAISKDTFLTLATKIGQISEGGEDCTEGKTLIDTAIIKNSVPASSNDAFPVLANKIGQIDTTCPPCSPAGNFVLYR